MLNLKHNRTNWSRSAAREVVSTNGGPGVALAAITKPKDNVGPWFYSEKGQRGWVKIILPTWDLIFCKLA